jgi:hypothetical protein
LEVLTNAAQPRDILGTPRANVDQQDLEAQLQDALSEEKSSDSGPANFLLKRELNADFLWKKVSK